MRITGWRLPQICDEIKVLAIQAVNDVSDDQVAIAKANCPVGTVTREGKWKIATVTFMPKTRNRKKIPIQKQKVVSFQAQQFTGRTPGDLRNSIRRVNKSSRPGNVRVYAGNKAVNYAHFIEYGTVKMKRQSFMRPAFQQIKKLIRPRIEQAIASHHEVK